MKRAATTLFAMFAIAGCHRGHAAKQQVSAENASPLASPAERSIVAPPDAAPAFADTFHHAGCKPTAPEPAAPQSSALASTMLPAAAADGCTAPAVAPPAAAASSPMPPR